MIRLVMTAVFIVALASCGGSSSSSGSDDPGVSTVDTDSGNTGNPVAGSGNTGNTDTGSADTTDSGNSANGEGAGTPSDSSGVANNNSGPTASSLTATHSNGQTFLVWNEAGAGVEYHVYRSNSPITNDNLCLLYTSPSPRDRG